ncbi:hypothetical protein LP421_03565 (plasmid) [Rhizobium sp. RCAM05350]|nr:hypothetical protein LP421_03565 [Rhizobium sp. RCAM05350]
MARRNDDAGVQALDGFGKDQAWGGDSRFASQALQQYENFLGKRMLHQVGICAHGKEDLSRPICGEGGGNVEQLLFAQPNQRAAHESAEGERIRRICQHPHKGQDILRFLPSH